MRCTRTGAPREARNHHRLPPRCRHASKPKDMGRRDEVPTARVDAATDHILGTSETRYLHAREHSVLNGGQPGDARIEGYLYGIGVTGTPHSVQLTRTLDAPKRDAPQPRRVARS